MLLALVLVVRVPDLVLAMLLLAQRVMQVSCNTLLDTCVASKVA